MDFIAAMVVPLGYLIESMLALISNILDNWVNLSAAEPLTTEGLGLADSLAKICISVVETVARVLSYTH